MRTLVLACVLALAGGNADERDDPRKWEPVAIGGRQKMPRFEDIASWLHSRPLQPADLKGKVVVVHFLTFG